MGSSGSDKAPRDTEMENSEATIEIKVKTMDSQTYTLRVDKQMPVPALREQIASATGVSSEQQRLICRGRVLNDDQLLSAYHVEDGHTLHLVVRQPVPPPSDGSSSHSANNPASGTSRVQINGVPTVIQTFNIPDQGDGVPPAISQIVSFLGSLGLSNMASGSTSSDARDRGSQGVERTSGGSGMTGSSQVQTEQASRTSPSDRARGTVVTLESWQLELPDSLVTLTQYLSHIRNEFAHLSDETRDAFDTLGRLGRIDFESTSVNLYRYSVSNIAPNPGTVREGPPTPATLAEALLSTRQLLTEQVGDVLQHLARLMEDHGNVTDSRTRDFLQMYAWSVGSLLNNISSILLELGRAASSLCLGQTPSEAFVDAGPSVFISPTSLTAHMVYPVPVRPRGTFGSIPVEPIQPGSDFVHEIETVYLPRDLQTHRGSSTETPNITRQEHAPNRSGQSNRSADFAGESGLQVAPIRTTVAAVLAPGNMSDEQGSQASGENPSPGAQPEQHPARDGRRL